MMSKWRRDPWLWNKVAATVMHVFIPPVAGYYSVWILWNWVIMMYVGAYNEFPFFGFITWSFVFTVQIAVLPIMATGVLGWLAVFSFTIGQQAWEAIVAKEAQDISQT